METDTPPARAYSDWDRTGDSTPADWVSSDRVTSVREEDSPGHAESNTDESAIIDVPEEPLLPPRPRERPRYQYDPQAHYETSQEASYEPARETPPHAAPMPPQPEPEPRYEPQYEPRHHTRPGAPVPPPGPPAAPEPQPVMQGWQPVAPDGQWLPPGMAGSNWAGDDSPTPPPPSSGRRRRYRDSMPGERVGEGAPVSEPAESDPSWPHDEPGRRARSRHSAEFRDYGVRNFVPVDGAAAQPPPHAPAAAPAAGPPPPPTSPPGAEPPPPRLAPPPHLEPAPRHRGADSTPDEWNDAEEESSRSGGQSVADLLARLQVQPSGGGRRRRRED
jgi:hypothetical protein